MNENDGRVVIEITGDDSGLEHALTDAEQRTREISSRAAQTAGQASQAAQTAAGAAASAAANAANASEIIAQLGNSAGNAVENIKKVASALNSTANAADKASLKMATAEQYYARLSSSTSNITISSNDYSSALNKLTSVLEQCAASLSSINSTVSALNSNMQNAGGSTANYSANLERMEAILKECSESLSKTNSKLDEMSSGVRDTGDSADNTDGILQKLGSTIKGVFTVALIKEFAEAVKDVGSEFEYSLDKVSSIADTTAVSIGEISDGILALSSDMGVHAADLNEAFYQSVSAGVDTADALGMVETAVKSAKAGFTDTTTAVDGLTTVLNAYKTANLDANDVANKFLITQNLGKTSFGEIASAIGNIAPTANAAGVNIEELLSGVASLTANGIVTSQAMTGLKAALSNIITPSSNAAKVAEELGIEFNAAALKSKGLGGFLDDLAEKTGGDTEIMAQLFGSVEALNTVLTLTSEGGSELFNKTMSEMATNTTALDNAYDTMTDNLTSNLDVMKAAAENFGIEIYNSVSGGLQNVVQSATDYIKRLRDAFTNDGFNGLAGELFQIAFDAISELGNGIAAALPEIVPQALETVTTVANTILDNIDTVVDTAEDIITALGEALSSEDTLDILTTEVPAIMVRIASLLTTEVAQMNLDLIQIGIDTCEAIADGLVHYDWETAASKMMNNLADELETAQKKVYLFLDDLFSGGEMYGGDINNVVLPTDGYAGYLTYMRDGIDETAELIGEKTGEIAESYDSFYGKVSETATGLPATMQGASAAMEESMKHCSDTVVSANSEIEESSASASAALEDSGKTAGKVSEEFKGFYDDLEFKLAHGDITEDEFKKQLSDKLNSDEQYATAAYTSYWNKVKDTSKKSSSDAKEKVSEDFQSFIDEQDRLKALGEKNGGISEETYWNNVGKKLNETADSKTNSAYENYWTNYNKWLAGEEKRKKQNFEDYKAALRLREQTDDNYSEEDYYNALKEALESDEYKDNSLLASERDSVKNWFEQADKRKAAEYKQWKGKLENRKQTNENFSEEDYYKALREKLYSEEYINNPELNSERDAVNKWFEQADKRKADDVKAQIETLKAMRQNGDITEEQYYEKLKEILFSDENKNNTYLNSLREQVNNYFDKKQTEADKETLKNQQKSAKEELSQLKSNLTDTVNEYKKKLDEVTKARDSFESKLNENIFSTKEETITDARTGQTKKVKTDTVADIQKKINSRKKLAEKLKSLMGKENPIPNGLLQELAGMDPDEALRFAEQLDKMGEGQWNKIVDSYNEYTDINKKIADDIYGPQITDINTQFAADLGTILGDVSGDAAEKGAELISNFVSGVDLSSADAIESIKKFGDNVISQLNSAVSDAKLEDGKMTFSIALDDKTDGTETGKSIAESVADGISENSGVISQALADAVLNAYPDLKNAAASRHSSAASSAAASAPSFADFVSAGVQAPQQQVTVPDITIGSVKLVLKDGRVLAETVNSENQKLHIKGAKT